MNANTYVMLALFVTLAAVSLLTGGTSKLQTGLKSGLDTLRHIWPLIILALGISGLLQTVVPQELIARYLGAESGLKSYFIAWGAGAIIPGAPYTTMPIVASLLSSGSAVGPVMTMFFSSSLSIALTRIPYEIAFMSWRFSVLRILTLLVIPVLGGMFAQYLNDTLSLLS